MKSIAIYPGTFDPVTYGHIDVIKRASLLFNEIIVGVAKNTPKKTVFTIQERVSFIKKIIEETPFKNVSVKSFSGLAVDFAKEKQAKILIRGLRMVSDFEYEFQLSLTNRKLAPDIETIFLMPSETYSYISSQLIKEASRLGGDLRCFIPDYVEKALKRKLK